MTPVSFIKWPWLMVFSCLLAGCTSHRDNQLWSIGVVVYGLYLLSLLLTFLVPVTLPLKTEPLQS